MSKAFHLLTIFPDFFHSYLSQSLVGKALQKKLFEVEVHNLRKWSVGPHRKVDEEPYGGGEGMIFRPEPLTDSIEEIRKPFSKGRVIYLSCQGRRFDQAYARELFASYDQFLLVCGRYEGIDQRVIDTVIDEEISIGDYVLAGGEMAAMVLMDVLIRFIPGVLGKPASLEEESHEWGMLEYPQYTRPEEFRGRRVPEVLLSGNHEKIRQWRQEKAMEKTLRVRPDLIKGSSKKFS